MNTTDAILRAVHRASGVDFEGYRRQTAERRIRNRMLSLGIEDLASYEQLLRTSSQEVEQLIGRMTIKVSRFYRNPPVFDTLRTEVLPRIAELGRPVRLLSAGCGQGEEPYTLGMLLEQDSVPGTVAAVDIDPLALLAARRGRYDRAALQDLPATLAERFLERSTAGATGSFGVAPQVSARVVFTQADLSTSPSFAHAPFDLVCCRNVLIYWNPPTQRTILKQLLAQLRPGGFLCLGEAEWPDAACATLLDPVAPRLRIFRKAQPEQCP